MSAPDSLAGYAALHVISNFSFLRGASHPEELVMRAHELGYRAIALTDECSLAGVVRAHSAARECGIKLIIGSELQLPDDLKVVILAPHLAAYSALSSVITRARRRSEKGAYQIERRDLAEGLAGAFAIWLPPRDTTVDNSKAPLSFLRKCFDDRLWVGVGLFLQGDDDLYLKTMRQIATAHQVTLVAADDVHYHDWLRRPLQDIVTAIRLNTTVPAATQARFPNGERHLRSRERLAGIYPSDLLAETVRIASRCEFSLSQVSYRYPREIVPEGRTPREHLKILVEQGMRKRFPQGATDKVRQLVAHELKLIAELEYESFFLTVYDIVKFARSQKILCQGRGSAANSAVCYCLGITEVDPSRMEMLFERFISKERNQPPDIDVDFEHQRREEVIQYVYQKYGRSRAALAATVITYKLRSAVRDVGKALGMSLEQVDRLARNLYWWDQGTALPERLREVGFDPHNPQIKRLISLVAQIIGFPRHLSQHVGGFVISDNPLHELVPIENAAMPDRTVIQWDKDDLETLGLLKVDCLCLGMLSAIRRSFDLLRDFDGRELSMARIPAEDPDTYAMIQRADTIGVFQIESRAQMAMLPRLKPRCYYDLVIEVAIIRPGPIQGDMVHPYLRRRNGEEPVTYPSEEVRGILQRTLGVPLFQEQVIKLAMVAAGFSGGEADQLRRTMATWKRNGGIGKFRQRLIDGMLARGYEQKFAEQIFRQIEGFGEYGFPESHSASFALLAYISAWLKCHEPAAFTGALLNSLPMGFYAPAQLVQDAARHGVSVLPPDVRHSDYDCALEHVVTATQPALRLGFRLIKGMREDSAMRIREARQQALFRNVDDLARRASLDRHDLKVLAEAGALAGLSGNRYQASWSALGVEPALAIFDQHKGSDTDEQAAPLLRPPSEGDEVLADYTSIGLTLGRHPLALLRDRLNRARFIQAETIRTLPHGKQIRTGGLVVNRQRPGTATGIVFVTLEDETGHINLVVWSSLVEKQRRELLASRLLGVDGEVQREGDVIHIIAKRLFDYSYLLGRLETTSRDFH